MRTRGEGVKLTEIFAIVLNRCFLTIFSPHPQVTVSDWGENFCEVKWGEPADDGGADITGYVVEVRNRNRRGWNKAGATNSAEERTLNVTQVCFVVP